LEVTGLVDWEYAHAGHPFTDLGNVLRFEQQPAYREAVLSSYAERRGTAPGEALALARAADLWALVDLAARRGANPVAERAHDLLRDLLRDPMRDPLSDAVRARDPGFDTPRPGA
ncbi:phosphotransferase, partial [Nocardioides sp.]|uniref:phosphotransferase n=1 Tax=Nocardioides sp. TaxID=35761 RepID=UPI00286B768E